jgi:WD domain, G-beta repeat
MTSRPRSPLAWSLIGVLGTCPILTAQDPPVPAAKEVAVIRGHTNDVRYLAITPDGKTLVSGADDLTVRVWDVATGTERVTLRGHDRGIAFVAVTPDGKTVASADFNGVVKLWDAVAGRLRTTLTTAGMRPSLLELTDDGRTLMSATGHERVTRWDVAMGRVRDSTAYDARTWWGVAFSPDGTTLAFGDRTHRLRLADLPSGKERPLPEQSADVAPQVFSADGRTLVVIIHSQDMYQLYEVATGRVRCSIPRIREGRLHALTLHPGGRVLAWCYSDTGTIKLWDVAAGVAAGEIKTGGRAVHALAFTGDGNVLATAEGPDSAIRIWDVRGFWKARPVLADPDLASLWTDLAADDAAMAYRAVWGLAGVPKKSVSWIAERVQPLAAADPKRTAALIADLDNNRFAVRERATRALEELGESAAPALRKALADGPPMEARERIEDLLRKLQQPAGLSEQLRLLRAVEALECAGTPEARRVLEKLAGGVAEARLTREAKAALERLSRRRG